MESIKQKFIQWKQDVNRPGVEAIQRLRRSLAAAGFEDRARALVEVEEHANENTAGDSETILDEISQRLLGDREPSQRVTFKLDEDSQFSDLRQQLLKSHVRDDDHVTLASQSGQRYEIEVDDKESQERLLGLVGWETDIPTD